MRVAYLRYTSSFRATITRGSRASALSTPSRDRVAGAMAGAVVGGEVVVAGGGRKPAMHASISSAGCLYSPMRLYT